MFVFVLGAYNGRLGVRPNFFSVEEVVAVCLLHPTKQGRVERSNVLGLEDRWKGYRRRKTLCIEHFLPCSDA